MNPEGDPKLLRQFDRVKEIRSALSGSVEEYNARETNQQLNEAAHLAFVAAGDTRHTQRTQAAFSEPVPGPQGERSHLTGQVMIDEDTYIGVKTEFKYFKPSDDSPTETSLFVWANTQDKNHFAASDTEIIGRVVFDQAQPPIHAQGMAPIWFGEPRIILGNSAEAEPVAFDDIRAEHMVEMIGSTVTSLLKRATPEVSREVVERRSAVGETVLRVVDSGQEFPLPSASVAVN